MTTGGRNTETGAVLPSDGSSLSRMQMVKGSALSACGSLGIDPQVAIPSLKSMDEQVIDSVASERFQAVVLTSFVAAALLLALLGVYGVLEYSVSLRHRDSHCLGLQQSRAYGTGAAPGKRILFYWVQA